MRILLVGLTCWIGCSSVPEIPESGRVDVTGFMRQVEEDASVWTLERVTALFGTPVNERAGGQMHTLTYYGMEIAFDDSSVATITLTDARHTSPEGLRVGYVRDMVRQMLGPPSDSQDRTWQYQTESGTPVVLHWADDRISRLEWHYALSGR